MLESEKVELRNKLNDKEFMKNQTVDDMRELYLECTGEELDKGKIAIKNQLLRDIKASICIGILANNDVIILRERGERL